MKFKTIFLSAVLQFHILQICNVQIFAQSTVPLMPVDATTPISDASQESKADMASDILMPIPDSMPSANQEPVILPVSNVTPEPIQSQQAKQILPTQPIPANDLAQPQVQPKSVDTQISNKVKEEKIQVKQTTKPREGTLTNTELDFEVENQTGKTIYLTCFSYIKKRPFSRWHWNKSPVYKIEDDKNVIVDLPTIPDEEDRNNTYGYLGIFDNQKDAEFSTIELLDDNKKIDLDIIAQLHGKKVTIGVEKYGIEGEFYDFDFQNINEKKEVKKSSDLDFYVENRTGKTILVTCFVYEKKAKGSWLAKETKESWSTVEESRDDMSVWRFDKTPVIKIKPNERELIQVGNIPEFRDKIYARGYLAIFDEDEQELAENTVYELLPARRKLELGKLIDLKNKKIIIYTERYGEVGNIIEYVVKPTQKPNIKKIINGYFE